ncbi:MAG: hypothetical protein WA006_03840 [Rhodoglobus sp.]
MKVKLYADLRELGGLASLGELLARGHWRERIDIAVMHRKIIRVRKGWYALADEAEAVIRAWRVGGRLACRSAVAFHTGTDDVDTLHVEVPANAARLRSPNYAKRRLGHDDGVVVHWVSNPGGGPRRAVPLERALRQAERCRAP